MQLKRLRDSGRKAARRAAVARASVAVEFALITTFLLLPLFCGAADFICLLTAQAQLNTALQALVYYSWTNNAAALSPTAAATVNTESTLISAINSASDFPVTLNAGASKGSYSTLLYYCQTTATPYTITANATTNCPSGQILQIYVQFKVSTAVTLPLPLPLKLTNPFPLSATGSARVE